MPLTADELEVEGYADNLGRLVDIAELTGNRGVKSIAIEAIRARPVKAPNRPGELPHRFKS